MFELSVLDFHHKEISVRVKRKSGGKSGGSKVESSGKDKEGEKDSGKDGKKGSKGSKGKISTSVADEMEFVQVFMTLNEDERALIGHDFKDFIKECTFRGHICGQHKKLVLYT